MTDSRVRVVELEQRPSALVIWRCPKCGTILAKLYLARGSVVEVKCARCNTFAVKEAA